MSDLTYHSNITYLPPSVVEGQRDGKFSQDGKLGHSCVRVTKGRLYESRVRHHIVYLHRYKSKQLHP